MYGDPSNPAASSGASLSGRRSQSMSQSQTTLSSSPYPLTLMPLNHSRMSPFVAISTANANSTSTSNPPPTTTSMAASVFNPPQPIGPPNPALFSSYPSFPTATDYAVIVRRLPPETTEEQLRTMFFILEDLVGVRKMDTISDDEAQWVSAILRFGSLRAAQQAKDTLNGKRGISVELLNSHERASGPSSSGASSTTSPATAATQESRFNGSFSPRETTSPPTNGNYSHHIPANPAYRTFTTQSPIRNQLMEQPRVSGKSLINDATDDDDTGDILRLPLVFEETGNIASQRRATAPQLPITGGLSSLSLNTGPTNGVPAYQRGHPGMYPPSLPPHHQTPMSPSTMNGTGGSYIGNHLGGRPPAPPPANPSDQHAPCNTLYVGNLPIGASEDELKSIFSTARGYKRLCLRTKNNGPMCFVEFEDTSYATKALDLLYGTQLSNSHKGGIRLSFSKNPLGVRPAHLSGQGPSGPHRGPNGFMVPSSTGFMPSRPPPGLSAPPGLGTNRSVGPYSAPAMPNGSNTANGISPYPPVTVPNGTGNSSIPFGNGVTSFGGGTWAPNGYSSYSLSTLSPPTNNGYSPPLTGPQNGSRTGHLNGAAAFPNPRRGQF